MIVDLQKLNELLHTLVCSECHDSGCIQFFLDNNKRYTPSIMMNQLKLGFLLMAVGTLMVIIQSMDLYLSLR